MRDQYDFSEGVRGKYVYDQLGAAACAKVPVHVQVLKLLNERGYQAYFVGGFVRDMLLGRPSKDVDIATDATPVQILDIFPTASEVGAHFGITLVQHGGESIEVATFRLDGAYKDSRHPESVAFTYDLQEDLVRRDFTINGLVMDADGRVYDYVGGRTDLAAKIISTIGEPTRCFKDDALRMLRAVRFACQLNFGIAEKTFQGIAYCRQGILNISAERVRDELSRILTSGRAALGIHILQRTRLLELILPEVEALINVPQNPLHHPEGDVYTHVLKALRGLEPGCSLTLALGALLHDIGKPATFGLKDGQPTFYGHEDAGEILAGNVMNRLRFPGDVTSIVKSHVKQHMQFRNVELLRKAKLLRFVRQETFPELLALHKIDAMAGSGNMRHAEFVEEVLKSVPEEALRPVRLITGMDLIEMGMKPGPRFSEILETVETEQLEGRITTRTEAMVYVQCQYRDQG